MGGAGKLRKGLRYSGVGVCFAAILTTLQGCTDVEKAFFLFWLLILSLFGGGTEPGDTATTYTLTVELAGTGIGAVTSSPPGINCGSDCSEDYTSGTDVTLTPAADSGSTFAGWSGDSDCSDGLVAMAAATSCTATFGGSTTPPPSTAQYTLSASKTGTGTGTVLSNPAGINCGSTCLAGFDSGLVVTLIPTADSGSAFIAWGGDCNSSGQATMNEAKSCTATFNTTPTPQYTLSVSKTGTGSGTITSSSGGISCGSTCSADFTSGQVVTLTPAADSGSTFVGWSGDSDCSNGEVTVNADRSCVADFALITSILTIYLTGTGLGTVTGLGIDCPGDCLETYDPNTPVTLTALPSSNSSFTGWGGACSGTGNCSIIMNGSNDIYASFVTTPHIDSVSPSSSAVSTRVSISGAGFGASQGTSQVTFNGVTARVLPFSWSNTSIVVFVPVIATPYGASTSATVVVTVEGLSSNSADFSVIRGIIFHTTIYTSLEVFIMNPDGSGQSSISGSPNHDSYPSWSPDGTKIAFTSGGEIYTMTADSNGSLNRVQLTDNQATDYNPAWSPDGTKIAFVSSRDGNDEIYVMNANGTGQTDVTNNAADDLSPSWSPDGSKIVFDSTRDGNHEIYVMNANGTGETRLTFISSYDETSPAWSPNGTKIAYGRFAEIYVMNADGSGQTRLTNSSSGVYNYFPVWSPDSTRIAFISARDVPSRIPFHIWVMNADGSGLTDVMDGTYLRNTNSESLSWW